METITDLQKINQLLSGLYPRGSGSVRSTTVGKVDVIWQDKQTLVVRVLDSNIGKYVVQFNNVDVWKSDVWDANCDEHSSDEGHCALCEAVRRSEIVRLANLGTWEKIVGEEEGITAVFAKNSIFGFRQVTLKSESVELTLEEQHADGCTVCGGHNFKIRTSGFFHSELLPGSKTDFSATRDDVRVQVNSGMLRITCENCDTPYEVPNLRRDIKVTWI